MNAVIKETAITEFSEFESKLQTFKSKYMDVVYDLSDEEQGKQARSDRLTIGKVIASLDRAHKDLKAPLKEKVDLIDGERKRIKDELLEVQGSIKSQIETHEKEIADHMEMLQGKVDAVCLPDDFDTMSLLTVIQIQEFLDNYKSIDVDDTYEHRKADATLAQIETIKNLESRLAVRAKYEEEQDEIQGF